MCLCRLPLSSADKLAFCLECPVDGVLSVVHLEKGRERTGEREKRREKAREREGGRENPG